MFSVSKLLMLSLTFVAKSCSAAIFDEGFIEYLFAGKLPTIISPNQNPGLPWEDTPLRQCDRKTWDNMQAMRSMRIDNNPNTDLYTVGWLRINLDSLLTTEEQNSYDSLMRVFREQMYVRYPQKLAITWSPDLQTKAEGELQTICDAIARGDIDLTAQKFDDDENCMDYPLQSTNEIFDPVKYPNIDAYVLASGKTRVCFDNDSTLTRFELHVDNSEVMNLNTAPEMATVISTHTKFRSINPVTFNVKERMLQSMLDGRIKSKNPETQHALGVIKSASSSAEMKAKAKSAILDRVDSLEKDFRAEIDSTSLSHALFGIGHGKAIEEVRLTYLPSGGLYKLNGAVHSTPPVTNNNRACRLFF